MTKLAELYYLKEKPPKRDTLESLEIHARHLMNSLYGEYGWEAYYTFDGSDVSGALYFQRGDYDGSRMFIIQADEDYFNWRDIEELLSNIHYDSKLFDFDYTNNSKQINLYYRFNIEELYWQKNELTKLVEVSDPQSYEEVFAIETNREMYVDDAPISQSVSINVERKYYQKFIDIGVVLTFDKTLQPVPRDLLIKRITWAGLSKAKAFLNGEQDIKNLIVPCWI